MLTLGVLSVFVVTALATYGLVRIPNAIVSLDQPNARSLHSKPTPRGGGVAIVACFIAASVINVLLAGTRAGPHADAALPWFALAGMFAVAVVSYLDDRRSLGVMPRLGVQAGAAVFVLTIGGLLPTAISLPGLSVTLPTIVAVPSTLLFVVWFTNLFNFMDGMDGFAAGMAVLGFAGLAALAGSGHTVGVFAALAAAAAAGFLLWNFPPARIFMGDVGASSLGFLAAVLIVWGHIDGIVDGWLGLLVFAPFFFDATLTITRRALRRERVWQAHRSHLYQRLVALGWTHRRTTLVHYLLMIGCVGAALFAQHADSVLQAILLLSVVSALVAFAWWIRRCEQHHASSP